MRQKVNHWIAICFTLVVLQACSGNGFHLRKNVELPLKYQSLKIEELSEDSDFKDIFINTLEAAGGQVRSSATAIIKFKNVREGRRVVAYNKDRKPRVYLLFLKFEYDIVDANKKALATRRVTLDRSFIYDSNFALGKAEEERQIKRSLYEEAARLILLRMTYTKE